MRVIVPMAGFGDRFRRAGYTAPKPLIDVDGRPMVEHVLDLFEGETDIWCIVNEEHLATSALGDVLARRGARIVAIAPHKLGPVQTVLAAVARDPAIIADDEPNIVTYCDYGLGWSYARFKQHLAERDPDGCIVTYRGFHPHSLGTDLYGYLRVDGDRMLEIREKQAFTDDRMHEHASAGLYYFKDGARLLSLFRDAIEQGLKTGAEYFASLPFNQLVREGGLVTVFEAEHMLQWGTPADLEEYLGWSRYFASRVAPPRSRPRHGGLNLMPMAGAGSRFAERGYDAPKPLLDVSGAPMALRAAESMPVAERGWRLTVHGNQDAQPLVPSLRAGEGPVDVHVLEGPTDGQARTCALSLRPEDAAHPLLITACDHSIVVDPGSLQAALDDGDVDVLVFTYRGHIGARRHPAAYGYVVAGEDGRSVRRVSVKEPVSDDPEHDHVVIGTFWFRLAQDFLEAFGDQVAADDRVRGELYVDTTINHALALGRSVALVEVERFVCWGTPDEYETYRYWERHFDGTPRHPFNVATDRWRTPEGP